MGKALGGFISGFCLAIFLFSLMIYIYATPNLATMQTANQLNETVYGATHSSWFGAGLSLLDGVRTVGAIIPGAAYAGNLKDLLQNVKDLSESLKRTLGLLIMLTEASLYLMIGSFFGFIIGTMIALKPEQQVVVQAAPRVVYCSKCGTQNDTEAKHCSECGKKL